MAKVYLALLHFPVYNKKKEAVSTCITGFDLHDIARSSLTYGIAKYFVVNPMPAQRKFAERIINCWKSEKSFVHNWTRAEAFKLVELKESLEDVIKTLKNPIVVASSAKNQGDLSYRGLKNKIKRSRRPVLILLGTGWGLTEEVFKKADYILGPILGKGSYNHLSVRSAAAIILDRLFGR